MDNQLEVSRVNGVLVKYSQSRNPFKREADVIVMVRDRTISIPIDVRQKRFVEKEYPVGSEVELSYDGSWHINSKPIYIESRLSFENGTIYTN